MATGNATGTPPGAGSYPDGDPEAIRALAADLRRMAGRLTAMPAPAPAGRRATRTSRNR
ncbi:hypothetical protein [Actinoallomurus iriomotensis]|uniref:Uncharacterized protein n=1 Tax=Actinoallomurus iriomotensis TaxID=478107 RepID=A0A9W6RXY2_9ACTN|nr:hypothetical protein [Actinoallomurus iriomotensis]GLY81910.1 hypothetical protein Airi01_101770 [Actinoallomurus iriomotensis]